MTPHMMNVYRSQTFFTIKNHKYFLVQFLTASYNCFIKAAKRIFYGFTGVTKSLGMLGEHSKSLYNS